MPSRIRRLSRRNYCHLLTSYPSVLTPPRARNHSPLLVDTVRHRPSYLSIYLSLCVVSTSLFSRRFYGLFQSRQTVPAHACHIVLSTVPGTVAVGTIRDAAVCLCAQRPRAAGGTRRTGPPRPRTRPRRPRRSCSRGRSSLHQHRPPRSLCAGWPRRPVRSRGRHRPPGCYCRCPHSTGCRCCSLPSAPPLLAAGCAGAAWWRTRPSPCASASCSPCARLSRHNRTYC